MILWCVVGVILVFNWVAIILFLQMCFFVATLYTFWS
jgi:hypothetical protein